MSVISEQTIALMNTYQEGGPAYGLELVKHIVLVILSPLGDPNTSVTKWFSL